MKQVAIDGMAALRARFSDAELRQLLPVPYATVLRDARTRRAQALFEERWVESDRSRRETPVIRALHAVIVDAEPPIPLRPWDGSLA